MNHRPRREPFAAAIVLAVAALYISTDFASMSLDHDGLVYGNIATMLAQGEGAFWRLPFFDADIDVFNDHPPLGIYLQSLLVRLIDHQHTAIRLYMLIVMAAFLAAFWLLTRTKPLAGTAETHEQSNWWWAVLVLIIMPTNLRVLAGNYLEGLLAATSMLAIWLGLRALRGSVVGAAFAMALVVYMGLLIKGPAALFPLIALPCILVVVRGSIPAALTFGTVAVGTVGVLCIATWFPDADARAWLENYWMYQLKASIVGERFVENGRSHMLYRLATNVGIGTTAALILSLATGQRNVRWRPETTVWTIVGLSASLPLLLSARHYEHYLMPSLPYFALAIASAIPPMRLLGRRILQIACIVGWGLVLTRITVSWNSPGDDEHFMSTVHNMNKLTAPSDAVVFCPSRTWSSYQEVLYLYRNHGKQPHTRLDRISSGARFWLACDHVPEGVVELDRTIPPELRGNFRYVERL